MESLRKFFAREEGLVTLEWIGIAAVVLVAGIAIAFAVMEGADQTGGKVAAAAVATGTATSTVVAPDLSKLGDGK